MIALARQDNDRDALAGLIPVAGPLIWAVGNDDDDAFEDGWDWLAATDALIQGAGLVWAFSGPSGSSKKVAVTPTARRGFHGIALGGTF